MTESPSWSQTLRKIAFAAGAAGTALFAYGALIEARRLVVEHRTLRLADWPARLAGFRIALVTDLHLHHSRVSQTQAERAIAVAIDCEPDMVVLAGDFVDGWRLDSPGQLGRVLEPLLLMEGRVVAVPGNHDYYNGDPSLLAPILGELNIKLLRNASWRSAGVTWVGIDSANEGMADPAKAFEGVDDGPVIVAWHEPDLVDALPRPATLQLSGHSHGGQFVFPGGWAPMHSHNGRRYPEGFYPNLPTPLYVSRGVGTTFLPTRFLCPPEVSILTLQPI